MTDLSLTIPPALWQESGAPEDPRGRLYCSLEVNGRIRLHVEAWAVRRDRRGGQYFACDPSRECEDYVYLAVGATEPFQTLRIRNRNYAIIATPYCD